MYHNNNSGTTRAPPPFIPHEDANNYPLAYMNSEPTNPRPLLTVANRANTDYGFPFVSTTPLQNSTLAMDAAGNYRTAATDNRDDRRRRFTEAVLSPAADLVSRGAGGTEPTTTTRRRGGEDGIRPSPLALTDMNDDFTDAVRGTEVLFSSEAATPRARRRSINNFTGARGGEVAAAVSSPVLNATTMREFGNTNTMRIPMDDMDSSTGSGSSRGDSCERSDGGGGTINSHYLFPGNTLRSKQQQQQRSKCGGGAKGGEGGKKRASAASPASSPASTSRRRAPSTGSTPDEVKKSHSGVGNDSSTGNTRSASNVSSGSAMPMSYFVTRKKRQDNFDFGLHMLGMLDTDDDTTPPQYTMQNNSAGCHDHPGFINSNFQPAPGREKVGSEGTSVLSGIPGGRLTFPSRHGDMDEYCASAQEMPSKTDPLGGTHDDTSPSTGGLASSSLSLAMAMPSTSSAAGATTTTTTTTEEQASVLLAPLTGGSTAGRAHRTHVSALQGRLRSPQPPLQLHGLVPISPAVYGFGDMSLFCFANRGSNVTVSSLPTGTRACRVAAPTATQNNKNTNNTTTTVTTTTTMSTNSFSNSFLLSRGHRFSAPQASAIYDSSIVRIPSTNSSLYALPPQQRTLSEVQSVSGLLMPSMPSSGLRSSSRPTPLLRCFAPLRGNVCAPVPAPARTIAESYGMTNTTTTTPLLDLERRRQQRQQSSFEYRSSKLGVGNGGRPLTALSSTSSRPFSRGRYLNNVSAPLRGVATEPRAPTAGAATSATNMEVAASSKADGALLTRWVKPVTENGLFPDTSGDGSRTEDFSGGSGDASGVNWYPVYGLTVVEHDGSQLTPNAAVSFKSPNIIAVHQEGLEGDCETDECVMRRRGTEVLPSVLLGESATSTLERGVNSFVWVLDQSETIQDGGSGAAVPMSLTKAACFRFVQQYLQLSRTTRSSSDTATLLRLSLTYYTPGITGSYVDFVSPAPKVAEVEVATSPLFGNFINGCDWIAVDSQTVVEDMFARVHKRLLKSRLTKGVLLAQFLHERRSRDDVVLASFTIASTPFTEVVEAIVDQRTNTQWQLFRFGLCKGSSNVVVCVCVNENDTEAAYPLSMMQRLRSLPHPRACSGSVSTYIKLQEQRVARLTQQQQQRGASIGGGGGGTPSTRVPAQSKKPIAQTPPSAVGKNASGGEVLLTRLRQNIQDAQAYLANPTDNAQVLVYINKGARRSLGAWSRVLLRYVRDREANAIPPTAVVVLRQPRIPPLISAHHHQQQLHSFLSENGNTLVTRDELNRTLTFMFDEVSARRGRLSSSSSQHADLTFDTLLKLRDLFVSGFNTALVVVVSPRSDPAATLTTRKLDCAADDEDCMRTAITSLVNAADAAFASSSLSSCPAPTASCPSTLAAADTQHAARGRVVSVTLSMFYFKGNQCADLLADSFYNSRLETTTLVMSPLLGLAPNHSTQRPVRTGADCDSLISEGRRVLGLMQQSSVHTSANGNYHVNNTNGNCNNGMSGGHVGSAGKNSMGSTGSSGNNSDDNINILSDGYVVMKLELTRQVDAPSPPSCSDASSSLLLSPSRGSGDVVVSSYETLVLGDACDDFETLITDPTHVQNRFGSTSSTSTPASVAFLAHALTGPTRCVCAALLDEKPSANGMSLLRTLESVKSLPSMGVPLGSAKALEARLAALCQSSNPGKQQKQATRNKKNLEVVLTDTRTLLKTRGGFSAVYYARWPGDDVMWSTQHPAASGGAEDLPSLLLDRNDNNISGDNYVLSGALASPLEAVLNPSSSSAAAQASPELVLPATATTADIQRLYYGNEYGRDPPLMTTRTPGDAAVTTGEYDYGLPDSHTRTYSKAVRVPVTVLMRKEDLPSTTECSALAGAFAASQVLGVATTTLSPLSLSSSRSSATAPISSAGHRAINCVLAGRPAALIAADTESADVDNSLTWRALHSAIAILFDSLLRKHHRGPSRGSEAGSPSTASWAVSLRCVLIGELDTDGVMDLIPRRPGERKSVVSLDYSPLYGPVPSDTNAMPVCSASEVEAAVRRGLALAKKVQRESPYDELHGAVAIQLIVHQVVPCASSFSCGGAPPALERKATFNSLKASALSFSLTRNLDAGDPPSVASTASCVTGSCSNSSESDVLVSCLWCINMGCQVEWMSAGRGTIPNKLLAFLLGGPCFSVGLIGISHALRKSGAAAAHGRSPLAAWQLEEVGDTAGGVGSGSAVVVAPYVMRRLQRAAQSLEAVELARPRLGSLATFEKFLSLRLERAVTAHSSLVPQLKTLLHEVRRLLRVWRSETGLHNAASRERPLNCAAYGALVTAALK